MYFSKMLAIGILMDTVLYEDVQKKIIGRLKDFQVLRSLTNGLRTQELWRNGLASP